MRLIIYKGLVKICYTLNSIRNKMKVNCPLCVLLVTFLSSVDDVQMVSLDPSLNLTRSRTQEPHSGTFKQRHYYGDGRSTFPLDRKEEGFIRRRVAHEPGAVLFYCRFWLYIPAAHRVAGPPPLRPMNVF